MVVVVVVNNLPCRGSDSRQPLTAEGRVQSHASPPGICGRQNENVRQVFQRVFRFCPVSIISAVFSYSIYSLITDAV
jgi:hypothetical protein